MRHSDEDAELRELVRRYVTPGRRYLKLGGGLLRLEEPELGRFVRLLAADAGVITAPEIATLLKGGWRERRTAAWLVAVSRRTEFRDRLGELLLASEVCCAGSAYCVALASFGTPDDADHLTAYLDRYLRRPDLGYDQSVAMGALVYVDLNLGHDKAARFLAPDGLWHQWLQGRADGRQAGVHAGTYADSLSLIRRLCAFVDDCAELRQGPWSATAGFDGPVGP
ncbi:DUF6000 family protein [Streptomyces sp. NPDC046925]|uniref:DUF6000 family protein n=1 Tax=Streptomyces sp. NPDC046925 TaxID=3155375 RepID=UPI0033D68FB2